MSRECAASTGGAEISAKWSAPAVIDEDPAGVKSPIPVEVVVARIISIFAALQQGAAQTFIIAAAA
jgi:hypothetical protein